MKGWIVVNKRKEFLYFKDKPIKHYKGKSLGHYIRTDTWGDDISDDMKSYSWVDDAPKDQSYWYTYTTGINFKNEINFGKRINKLLIPFNIRKTMTFGHEPIYLDIDI